MSLIDRRVITRQRILSPEVNGVELLASYMRNMLVMRGENPLVFFRAQVITFDSAGGRLENPSGSGLEVSLDTSNNGRKDIPARPGAKSNPARSIRARLVTKHLDQYTRDENLRVYWPMFGAVGPEPILGDFVYVVFEDGDLHNGLWVSKVPGAFGEDQNAQSGLKDYSDDGQRLAGIHGDSGQEPKDDEQLFVVGSRNDGTPKSDLQFGRIK